MDQDFGLDTGNGAFALISENFSDRDDFWLFGADAFSFFMLAMALDSVVRETPSNLAASEMVTLSVGCGQSDAPGERDGI